MASTPKGRMIPAISPPNTVTTVPVGTMLLLSQLDGTFKYISHASSSTGATRTPHAPITAAGAITAADTDSLIVIPASVTGACPIALSSSFTGPLTVDNRSATAARITATGKTIAGDPYLDLYTGVTTLIAGGNDITASG